MFREWAPYVSRVGTQTGVAGNRFASWCVQVSRGVEEVQAQNWVTLVVGLLAASGVIGTLWQRQRSEATDRRLRLEYEARAEWWRRFEWAADKSVSGDIEVPQV